MPELDHLVYSCSDLAAGVRTIADLTGVDAVPGGSHPGVGTHNALLTFDDITYFEIIAPDPTQPEPGAPRPFGLDDGAGPRLAGFAVHPSAGESIDEVVAALRAAGHDPGPIVSMRRTRPDGVELAWRLTLAPSPTAPAALPFVIDWGDTPSPARSLPSMGRLTALSITTPDARAVEALHALDLGSIVTVDQGDAHLSATVTTAAGDVVIDPTS